MIFSGKERRVKRFLRDLDVDAFSALMLDLDLLSKNIQDSDNLYNMGEKYSNPGALLALISYAGGAELLFSMDVGDLAKYLIELYGNAGSEESSGIEAKSPKEDAQIEYEDYKSVKQTAESAFNTWAQLLVSVHEMTDDENDELPEMNLGGRYSADGSELLRDDEQLDDPDEDGSNELELETIFDDENKIDSFQRYDVERIAIDNALVNDVLNYEFGIGIESIGPYLNDVTAILHSIQDSVISHYENLNKDESSYPSNKILEEDSQLRSILNGISTSDESRVGKREDVVEPTDAQEEKVTRRRRRRVGPEGMLTEIFDKKTEDQKKVEDEQDSNSEKIWGGATDRTLITLLMSDEEKESIEAESTTPLGYESGEISGTSYTDLQRASLRRAVKKIENKELFELSLSKEIERVSKLDNSSIDNKSLVHPIFKKVYEKFSCESILKFDELANPSIRSDAEDIIKYIEEEIEILFDSLRSSLGKKIRNTSRGAKTFEIRVEKVNVAVGNAIEAAKIWDAYNDSELSRFGVSFPDNLRLIRRIKDSNIYNIIIDIVKHGSLVHYSGYKVQKKIERKSDTIKYNVEGAAESLRDAFENIFEQQIRSLVSKCLDPTNHVGWTNQFITLYAATNIQFNNIMRAAVQSVSNPYSGSTYISCPVCSKNIRYRSFSKKGGTRTREDNDYKIREYSLIRPSRDESSGGVTVHHPGGVISKDELANHSGVNIDGEIIDWARANKMLASKSMFEQRSGNMARHAILKSLGGKPLFSTDRYISSTKFACPMNDYLIPKGSASTSECGFSIDVKGLSDDSFTSADSINSSFQKNIIGSSEPEDIFEAIARSDLSSDKKDLLSDYIERKRSGGWSFSDTHFACPCNVSPKTSSSEDIASFREKHKDALLLIPHIGFAKQGDRLGEAINETYSNNNLKWSYHPPTNIDGSEKFFEDGASGYMVCGVPTSLSSFNRDKSDPTSLDSIINSARQSGGDGEVEKVIETLLRLGVDIADLLSIDALFENNLDKSGRMDAISKIMKSAMAINMSGKNNNLSLINNLGLRCGHGHAFTIGQSVRVGATHAGIKVSGDLFESGGLLGKTGLDNFNYISKKYFRPVTSSSELSRLNDVYDSGSAYSDFSLSEVSFVSPADPGLTMSFSSANYRKLRSKVFVNTSSASREYDSVYSYDPSEKTDLDSISREAAITSSGDTDAGDAVADNSLNAEDLVATDKVSVEFLVKEIFEMLSGALEMVSSLRSTSQSLNIETVLLNDEEECCNDATVANIREILSDLFRGLGGTDRNIEKLFLELDELLLNRLRGQKISAIRGYGRVGIESIFTRIIIENLGYDYSDRSDMADQDTLAKIKHSVSRSVDMLVPRGYEYSDLFPDKSTSGAKKIVLRRRAEHVGRQIMGGSAVYFSEVISDILKNRFSKKTSSSIFSGLDIDIGDTDPESIINIDHIDISKLKSVDYLESSVDLFNSNGGDKNKLRASYVESKQLIRSELIRFRGMVTTHKYMKLGSDIASRGIDAALDLESDEVKRNIKKYIFGEDKIINVSLSPQDKYFSGANPGEFVGGYTSPVLIAEHKEGGAGIIHLLSDGNNIRNVDGLLDEDEHQIFKNSRYSREYFLGLFMGDLPYGCEELGSFDDLNSFNDRFKNSSWTPCLVKRNIDGSPPYKLSKKYKLSILDHPNTIKKKDENGVIYYENYDFNLDTSSGIQLGQQVPSTDSSGVNKLYPPSPYASTGIGIPLPLDYDGMYSRKKGEFNIPQVFTEQERSDNYKDVKFRVPIQECSAPIDIGLTSGPINAADFMKRVPKYAVPIFEEIDRIYSAAIRESSGLDDSSAEILINSAKNRIKKLHSKYRNLPFEVESGKNRTGIGGDGGLRNIGGLYVSMWDYATMYKMATYPAYSIEWGGPGRYSDPESYGKIVSFIANLYNVDLIAEALTKRTKEEYTIEDVLGGVKKDDAKDIAFASGVTDSIPRFYSIGSDDDNSKANMTIYTDWDYPGAGSDGDMSVVDYSRKLSRLEKVRAPDNQDRLSPSDIATLRGLYGKSGGPEGVQAGPYGETKSSDATLSVYAFTAKLRDFASNFILGGARDKKESSGYLDSKFLSKISERKGDLRRIIFMSEVSSLLDEMFKK